MGRKPKVDTTLQDSMRRAIIAALDDPELTASERAKVIEAGVKILALEHRIHGGSTGRGRPGSFFES